MAVGRKLGTLFLQLERECMYPDLGSLPRAVFWLVRHAAAAHKNKRQDMVYDRSQFFYS